MARPADHGVLLMRRRRFLGWALGGAVVAAAAGTAGFELVNHGVLPGKSELDALDGACALEATDFVSYAAPGPEISGTFYSAARNREVGYTIGYPPGHGPGDALPLVVMLHGEGGNHANALPGLTPARAVALRVPRFSAAPPSSSSSSASSSGAVTADGAGGEAPLPPLALVTVDGGTGYWNAHPGDDPMGMLTGELIPLCQRRGLGGAPHRIGAMGISMGGFGALLLAEKHPDLISAVAVISPAVWTSYAQARAVNPGAYAAAADFAADDAVTHASALADKPVRIASGFDDPFRPGVEALVQKLPKDAVVEFAKGCHDGSFFTEQEPPSLAFLGSHVA